MPNYRRNKIPGGTYFFTVTLLNRKSNYLTEHINSLRNSFSKVKNSYPFKIGACVVLPEHLHCIWTLPEGDNNFSQRWRIIK